MMIYDVKDDLILQDFSQESSMSSKYDFEDNYDHEIYAEYNLGYAQFFYISYHEVWGFTLFNCFIF